MGRGPDVTSNREHNDSVVRIFYLYILLVFVGKAEKVVQKFSSQVYCKGDVATPQNYRRYYAIPILCRDDHLEAKKRRKR